MPIRKYFVTAGYLFLLLLSVGLLGYGWMMRQFESAQNAFRQGDIAGALESYGRAEMPFQKLPWLSKVFKEEYAQVNFNQVAILYNQRQNQEALEKLEQLPSQLPALAESGDYSFWMGNLLFRQATESKNPEASFIALKAALSEYQKGLAAKPDDWDLKFDYELVRSIFAKQDRNQEKQEQKVKSIIDKMRPQEPNQQQLAPEKRG
jgi:tetratricopeptide (TPR) repeat protein